jgi:hypothetical protein
MVPVLAFAGLPLACNLLNWKCDFTDSQYRQDLVGVADILRLHIRWR